MVLAAWRFRELKTVQDPENPEMELTSLSLVSQGDEEEARRGLLIGLAQARGENLARTLQSRPGNIATPTHLGEEAKRLGKEYGLKVTVLGPKEIQEEGMGALLAVAQGSDAGTPVHRPGAPGRPQGEILPWCWWGRGSPSMPVGSPSNPPPGWRT